MFPFRSTRSAESYGLKVACTRPAIIEAQNWIFVNSLTPMIAKSIVLQVSLDSTILIQIVSLHSKERDAGQRAATIWPVMKT